MKIMGIDIGGSGIKGAIVDIQNGQLLTERHRIPTPQPATPDAVSDTVVELIQFFDWSGPVGCTFPAIMKEGVAHSAANVDDTFIGTDVQALIRKKSGCPTSVLNDADAAGIAEMHFGAGRGSLGTVMILTFGTGIGSAVFRKGVLVPNVELGHIFLKSGKEAEEYAAERIRSEKELSWKKWGKRVNRYLQHVEFIFSPDLFIIGGGVSKKPEKFFDYLSLNTRIVPAELQNEAGIVGAAVSAQDLI